jgi:hypothetical protein
MPRSSATAKFMGPVPAKAPAERRIGKMGRELRLAPEISNRQQKVAVAKENVE